MAATSIYLANAVLEHAMGKTAIFSLPTAYMALIRATAGQSPRNTAVTVGQTTVPATPNGMMYRVTTAGTTGASEPSWTTTAGGTTTDGTATWTEMTPDLRLNNSYVTGAEASYTGYSRATTSGTTMWGPAINGNITNGLGPITFGQNTGAAQVIAAAATYDAATGGNMLVFEVAGASNGVLNVTTNVTPSFGTSAFLASIT